MCVPCACAMEGQEVEETGIRSYVHRKPASNKTKHLLSVDTGMLVSGILVLRGRSPLV